ncbi:MAG: TetR/AcrR family transcriptional regulator [Actinomycetota bacterium]
MSDLRTRQRELGRRAVVEACAALVTERRHLDFSMQEVADGAGVSLRTVYNHFATREEMLDALGDHLDEATAELGGPSADDLRTVDQLLDAIAVNHRIFEELGGISEALAQLPLGDVGRDADRVERTETLVRFMSDLMPSAPPEEAKAIAILLRHLLSHRSWFWLTREYGLETEQAIDVARWAVDTLLSAAEAGDLPSTRRNPDA